MEKEKTGDSVDEEEECSGMFMPVQCISLDNKSIFARVLHHYHPCNILSIRGDEYSLPQPFPRILIKGLKKFLICAQATVLFQ